MPSPSCRSPSRPPRSAAGRTPVNAPAVVAAIDRAVSLALAGEVAAVVTNPIDKAALYRSGFDHPGHTEYLAARCGIAAAPVMMLVSDRLRGRAG